MATLPGTLTAVDVSLQISSELIRTEKRLSPSWTVAQLKARLESVTGIPPSCMRLELHATGRSPQELASDDQTLGGWITGLGPATGEIVVHDLRPPAHRNLDLLDASGVEKYRMPDAEYSQRTDSVLAWKKNNQLGRFDPEAPERERERILALQEEVGARGIAVGGRCRLGEDSARRGVVRFVGDVEQIPGGGPWVGVELDEPVGKNDGSVGGKRYFECKNMRGVFVRPERVEMGEFALDSEDDLEEL